MIAVTDQSPPRLALSLDVLIVPRDIGTAVTTAVAVEAQGYRRLWVAESPPLGRPDCYLTLNECARATRRLVVGPGVTNPVTRDLSVTAGAVATLHELTGGRIVLGMGAGGSAVLGAGLRPATIARLEATIERLREVLDGRGVQVPIFLAAGGPRALHVAGRLADGVITSVGTHPALLRRAVGHVEDGIAAAGRRRADVEIAVLAPLAISHDREEIRDEAGELALATALAAAADPLLLPDDLQQLRHEAEAAADARDAGLDRRAQIEAAGHGFIDAVALAGDAAGVRRRVHDMADAGADGVILYLLSPASERMLDRFSADVLPELRSPSSRTR